MRSHDEILKKGHEIVEPLKGYQGFQPFVAVGPYDFGVIVTMSNYFVYDKAPDNAIRAKAWVCDMARSEECIAAIKRALDKIVERTPKEGRHEFIIRLPTDFDEIEEWF